MGGTSSTDTQACVGNRWRPARHVRTSALSRRRSRCLLAILVVPCVACALVCSVALAKSTSGPQPGLAYTGHKALANAGHLAVTISISGTKTKGSAQADCGEPRGNFVVTEIWDSKLLRLRHGDVSFSGKARIDKLTQTHTNATVSQTHYRGQVRFTASFVHGHYRGKVSIDGSPCHETTFDAYKVPPPTPG